MVEIFWQEFSWEAFATLSTGLATVAAAGVLGARQISIARRQTEISAAQSDNDVQLRLQELRMALLYDRRACVSRMRDVAGNWMREGRVDSGDWEALREVLWDAQLLFSDALSDDIGSAFIRSKRANHWAKRARESNERGDAAAALESQQRKFTAEEKLQELMPTLLDRVIAETRIA